MVSYVLILALMNLALGFGLAVYLGRQYRLMAAGGPGIAGFSSTNFNDAFADLEGVGFGAPTDGHDSGRPNRTSLQAPIAALTPALERYQQHLTDADDRLRQCLESPEAQQAEGCLNLLREATDEYATSCVEPLKVLAEVPAAEMQQAVRLQNAEIEMTRRSIEAFDCQANLRAACRQMAPRVGRLISAVHRLRDCLEKAFADTSHNAAASEIAAAPSAPRIGIISRAHAYSSLMEWHNSDPRQRQPMSIALLDLDQFSQINARFGTRAGDLVLRAVPAMLDSEPQDPALPTPVIGQRFLCLFPKADIREAGNLIERFRQTLEATRFDYRNAEIEVTASCGVVEATATDAPAMVLARAEAALKEAKGYGGNRTFLGERGGSTAVGPTDFPGEERRIPLEVVAS